MIKRIINKESKLQQENKDLKSKLDNLLQFLLNKKIISKEELKEIK